MAIPITQSFEFNSQLPNFERDDINSALFVSQDLLNLSIDEGRLIAEKYDVGHIVWDIVTRHHYVVESKTTDNSGTIGRFKLLGPTAMATQDWYDLGDTYIPRLGEIIIFTDHRTVNGKNIPSFKVGDGINNPTNLPFSDAEYATSAGTAEVANKVAHQLHIGPHDYDGSEEVTVGLYDGSYIVE